MQNDKKIVDLQQSYLIVGLGNPGKAYEETRHNIGFQVVRDFAGAHGFILKATSHLSGDFAQGTLQGKKILLLLPTTFMNNSGEAVRRCIDYYKVPRENVLIVCDDVALPCGMLRIKAKGSDGGHNGLTSVETHLGTQYYARLRVGVGAPSGQVLADYVLGRFLPSEKPIIAQSVVNARAILESWALEGIASAMQKANAKIKSEPA